MNRKIKTLRSITKGTVGELLSKRTVYLYYYIPVVQFGLCSFDVEKQIITQLVTL